MIPLTSSLVCPSVTPAVATERPGRRAGRLLRTAGEKFLRGPIPWWWLERAGALPGKAVHVGLAIWQESGCRGSSIVSVNQSTIAASFGCDRATVHRALHALEGAGLVRMIERHAGRRVKVELLVHAEPR